jgi:tetratricopeptide (TPR) repeat protein
MDALRAVLEELGRISAESGEAERKVDATWLRRIVALSLGDMDEVERAARDHRMFAEELRQPSQLWYDAVMRSNQAYFRGELEVAERAAEEALRLGERAQSWDAGFSYRISLFFIRREQGRLAEVEELVRQTVDEYPGYRVFRCLLVLLEWELGRLDDAQFELERLAADDFETLPRDSEWIFCLCVLTEVVVQVRDTDRAATLYELLAPYAHLNALAAGEIAIGSVDRYLGLLAEAMGRRQDAARHLERAVEMNARMRARPWLERAAADLERVRAGL